MLLHIVWDGRRGAGGWGWGCRESLFAQAMTNANCSWPNIFTASPLLHPTPTPFPPSPKLSQKCPSTWPNFVFWHDTPTPPLFSSPPPSAAASSLSCCEQFRVLLSPTSINHHADSSSSPPPSSTPHLRSSCHLVCTSTSSKLESWSVVCFSMLLWFTTITGARLPRTFFAKEKKRPNLMVKLRLFLNTSFIYFFYIELKKKEGGHLSQRTHWHDTRGASLHRTRANLKVATTVCRRTFTLGDVLCVWFH